MTKHKMILRFFLFEVERQCTFSLMAADDLKEALQAMEVTTEKTDEPFVYRIELMDRLWYSVQALLVAAGNISKLLWPSKKLQAERGAKLRATLSVDENSILKPRTLRNHFEHFDERLEQWATSSKHGHFLDSNVGPSGMKLVSGVDNEPGDYLRNFDTTNFAVTFRGDVYELRPLIGAISDLWEKVNRTTKRRRKGG